MQISGKKKVEKDGLAGNGTGHLRDEDGGKRPYIKTPVTYDPECIVGWRSV